MANTSLNNTQFFIQGDGASTTAVISLGFMPSTASFVSASQFSAGDVSSNVSSAILSGSNITVTFVSAFSYLVSIVMNFTYSGNINVVATPSAPVRIDPTGTTVQPVSGTFWQATQPVSGTVTITPPANASSNQTQLNSIALGSPSNYGTSPGTVSVQGVNAFITNTVATTLASTTITGSVTVTGTFWQATQPISGAISFTTPQHVIIDSATLGTVAVSLASTTITGTVAVTQSTSPWVVSLTSTTITGTVAINHTQTAGQVLGALSNYGTSPGAVLVESTNCFITNTPTVTLASTTITSGTITAVTAITNALPTGANTIGKVDMLGNTGAILDGVNTAATAPANGVLGLGMYNSTTPSLATGQAIGIEVDYVGSLFVNPYRRSQIATATGTFTSTTATQLLAAQAAGVFADLGSINITQGLGATANVYFSVNVSDGTNTYKFNMFSNDSVSVTPTGSQPISMTFSPPLKAASAATAWTVAMSSATDTPTVNVTASFFLQKAS